MSVRSESLRSTTETESAYQLLAVTDLKIGDELKNRGKITQITLEGGRVYIITDGGNHMSITSDKKIWGNKA